MKHFIMGLILAVVSIGASAALRGIGGSSPSASTKTLGNGPVTPFPFATIV